MNREDAILLIERASSPLELFPNRELAQKLYHRLARLCHPDVAGRGGRAEAAFIKASKLWAQYNDNGNKSSMNAIAEWEIVRPLARGGIADLFCVCKNEISGLLKIARRPEDNDLLVKEEEHLGLLRADSRCGSFARFLPVVLDVFEASNRRALVFAFAPDLLSLNAIKAQLPRAVPFHHIIWMVNRALEILGYAHQIGIIHGGILPHHLLYRLADHGLVLIDWSCSVRFPGDQHIPLLVKRWIEHYPKEVKNRDAYIATDLYMTMRSAQWAADRIPSRFRALFDWCLAESPAARPHDAWELQDRWRKLAEEEYGKPTFMHLNIPMH